MKKTLLLLLSVLLISCGAGGSDPSDNTASLSFRIESADMPISASADICTTYGADTVVVTLKNSSGTTITSSSFACSAHTGTISGLASGSNLSVVITGTGGGSTKFSGTHTGITLASNLNSNIGTVAVAEAVAPTSPSITINGGATSTSSTAVTFTLSASDTVGVTGYYVSESSTTPASSASGWVAVTSTTSYSNPSVAFTLSSIMSSTYTVYVWFKDAAGNVSASASDTIILDTIAPSPYLGGITINEGSSTSSKAVTLSLHADDTVGVTGYYVSETSTTPTASDSDWVAVTSAVYYQSTTEPFTLSSGNGTKTVYAWFKDAAGNISSVSSDTITLAQTDTIVPTSLSITINGGATTATTYVTLTLSASDDTGVTGYYVSETSTKPTASAPRWVPVTSSTTYSTTTAPFTLTGVNGIKTVYAWFRDAAGNVSATAAMDSITLSDITAPASPTISILNGATATNSTSVTLTLSATDASGVTGYYVSETSTTPTSSDTGWVAIVNSPTSYSSTSEVFTLSSGNGTKTVYAWFKDAGGNISLVVNDTIRLSQYMDNGNGTVTDSTTSLIWQQQDDGTTRTWADAGTYCDGLSLGGLTGWRLPTYDELYALVDTSYFPTIDPIFTGTKAYPYWSSTTEATYTSYAWYVIFSNGNVNYFLKTIDYYVRCVLDGGSIADSTAPTSHVISINSGATSSTSTSVTLSLSASDDTGVTGYYVSESSTTPTASASGWVVVTSATSYSTSSVPFTLSSTNGTKTVYAWFKDAADNVSTSASDTITLAVKYTDNENGTVTDSTTSLMWQQQDDGTKRTWDDAGTYCDGLTLADYTDWRLPTIDELSALVDTSYSPTIDPIFTGTKSSNYWSSTTHAYYTSFAWSVYFYYGNVYYYSKPNDYYVRCVR